MKKLLFAVILAIASSTCIFAGGAPEDIVKVVENFCKHGLYIKAIYKNGDVKIHTANQNGHGNGWFDIDSKKITLKPTAGFTSLIKDDEFRYDKWDIKSDEDGNIILTEK
ncbi:MAG: hypothetical protein II563_05505 [Treponema sp.]|nr:hypothetical protein [Treponema sp.]MBQ4236948.1 hypothetical protein [Treponema sp.]MBR6080747.1 hypothetical protein [Treponema sp.]